MRLGLQTITAIAQVISQHYQRWCSYFRQRYASHRLRHACTHLHKQQEKRKLILLVTDGEPADIDESDPQHLRFDTKKAVEEDLID
jgi:nitric oxide reductase activation protein